MPAAAFIGPAIGAGVSLFQGISQGRQASKANDIAQQQLQLQSQVANKQMGLSNSLMGYADKTYQLSQPALTRALGYYQTLAQGNRSAVNQTLAPQFAQLTDTYRGAGNLVNNQLRGGARDYALAELARQKAGQLGLMPMQARMGAMGQLAGLGTNIMGQSQGWAGAATSALNGAGNTASAAGRQAYDMYKNAYANASNAGNNLANLLGPAIKGLGGGGGGGGGGFGGGDGNFGTPSDNSGLLPSYDPTSPYGSWDWANPSPWYGPYDPSNGTGIGPGMADFYGPGEYPNGGFP